MDLIDEETLVQKLFDEFWFTDTICSLRRTMTMVHPPADRRRKVLWTSTGF